MLRCALALRGLSPVVTAPQAMTAIAQVAHWRGGSVRGGMPRRSKAADRGWWFSVNIDKPGTVLPGQAGQLSGDLLAREHGH